MSKFVWRIILLILILSLSAIPVLAQDDDNETPEATEEAVDTPTSVPSDTAIPSNTPEPTATSTETLTPTPTDTATPEPTNTPTNTPTPEPTFTPTATEVPPPVSIDGALDMEPILTVLVEAFREEDDEHEFEIATNGPNSGFEALCSGGADAVMTTRYITDEEEALCEENGIDFIETIIGYQGLVFLVPANYTSTCIAQTGIDSVYGLSAEGSEGTTLLLDPLAVEPGPLNIYMAPADSPASNILLSTLSSGEARTDVERYEDTAQAVELIIGDTPGVTYMTLAEYDALDDAAQESVMILGIGAVEDPASCVTPSRGSLENGTYPAQRPLLVYTTTPSLPKTRALLEFVSDENGAVDRAEELAFTAASQAGYDRNKNNILLPLTGRTFSRPSMPPGITSAAIGEVFIGGSPLAFDIADALTGDLNTVYTTVTLNLDLFGSERAWNELCAGHVDMIFVDIPAAEEQLADCAELEIELYNAEIGTQAFVFAVAEKNEDLPACVTLDTLVDIFAAPIPEESDEIPLAEDREIPRGATNWQDLDGSYPDLPMYILLPRRSTLEIDWLFAEADAAGRFARTDQEDNVVYDRAAQANPGLFRAAAVANYEGGAITILSWQDYQNSEHKDDLRLLEIETDAGCVAPSEESFADGSYPFASTVSLYVNRERMESEAVAAVFWTMVSDGSLSDLEDLELANTNIDTLRREQFNVFTLVQEARQRAADRIAAVAQIQDVIDSFFKATAPQPEAEDEDATDDTAEDEDATPEAEDSSADEDEDATPEAEDTSADEDATPEAEDSSADEDATPEAEATSENSDE